MPALVELKIHPEVKLHQVSRYIYSHFAEHLGRCIYGGIWVGPDSKIKNMKLPELQSIQKTIFG